MSLPPFKLYSARSDYSPDETFLGEFETMEAAQKEVERLEELGEWEEGYDAVLKQGVKNTQGYNEWYLADEWEEL